MAGLGMCARVLVAAFRYLFCRFLRVSGVSALGFSRRILSARSICILSFWFGTIIEQIERGGILLNLWADSGAGQNEKRMLRSSMPMRYV